jgi:hypothetical protein
VPGEKDKDIDDGSARRARSIIAELGTRAPSIAAGWPAGAPGVPFQWCSESSLTPMLDTGDSSPPGSCPA